VGDSSVLERQCNGFGISALKPMGDLPQGHLMGIKNRRRMACAVVAGAISVQSRRFSIEVQ
jgi:hypothetical protein